MTKGTKKLLLVSISLVIFVAGIYLQKLLASNGVSYSWLLTVLFMVLCGCLADKLLKFKERSHVN